MATRKLLTLEPGLARVFGRGRVEAFKALLCQPGLALAGVPMLWDGDELFAPNAEELPEAIPCGLTYSPAVGRFSMVIGADAIELSVEATEAILALRKRGGD